MESRQDFPHSFHEAPGCRRHFPQPVSIHFLFLASFAGGPKLINAKYETVGDLPTFRDAYRKRRCIVPVDGFFEWKAINGQKAKQPYAIAMKDGAPFGIASNWEKERACFGEWIRTFAVITTMRMSWWPTFMSLCRSFWRQLIMPAGLATSPTRAT
jgi:hypothetical protein